MEQPKVAISGANGFLGKTIAVHLKARGFVTVPLGRSLLNGEPSRAAEVLAGTSVVINLAGAPILQRWNTKTMHDIYDSRVIGTQTLASAIALMDVPPKLFVTASAVGIYNSVDNHDEYSQLLADDFLGQVCKDWEKAATAASINPQTRLAILRLGVVLGKKGGAYPKMSLPFKLFVGGKIGDGTQWFPFVHVNDVVKAVDYIIDNHQAEGIYNLVAPETVTNLQFSKALAKQLHRPNLLTVPKMALKLLYGKAATVLTSGQYVKPTRLLRDGFKFGYPTLADVLHDLEDQVR